MTVVDLLPVRHEFHAGKARRDFLGAPFDPVSSDQALDALRDAGEDARFRYVVTPNVDHVVRLNQNGSLRPAYDHAWMTLCDSRPITMIGRLLRHPLPHVTGSDLTVSLFRSVLRDGDRITLIVGDQGIAQRVASAYPTLRLRTHVPPQGVLDKPDALQACVEFAAAEPSRFTFIAIGSPQSEKIAYALSHHPNARGVGLCIGAALEFLVGSKPRAPRWMRRVGLEWVHRMASDPKRLWRRYVYSVVPLVRLCSREFAGRGSRAG
jgi:N-acetylglucosaminyldiphosphoundecaprenol N-acetyl-beta-D-mannosaminyltransferase